MSASLAMLVRTVRQTLTSVPSLLVLTVELAQTSSTGSSAPVSAPGSEVRPARRTLTSVPWSLLVTTGPVMTLRETTSVSVRRRTVARTATSRILVSLM